MHALVFRLDFVVQVVSVIGSSASQQDDSHSHQVAAATLAAVVPAWLQAGKPLAQLAAAVVDPLADLLPHRRLPLLTALIVVVPQVNLQKSKAYLFETTVFILCWLAFVLFFLMYC